MSWVRAIHHVNMGIRDIERSKDWYEKVFGVERKGIGPESADYMLELYMGTDEFHLYKVENTTYLRTSHVAVEINDWDEMMAHLAGLGIPFDASFDREGKGGPKTRDHDGSYYVYIRDPDDNLIELVHHPKGLRWASPSA